MKNKNDSLMNRLTKSVRKRKREFSIMVLVTMVLSVIGGILPSIDGFADNGKPKSYLDLDSGPGTITLTNVSGEKSPSWQKVPSASKTTLGTASAIGPTTLTADEVVRLLGDEEESKKVDDSGLLLGDADESGLLLGDTEENKKVDESGWLLEDAEFTVTNLDEATDLEKSMVTDSEGRFTLTGLPVGKYEVKETKAPEGYEMLEKHSLVVEITENHPHVHLNFQNKELEVSPSINKKWTKGTEAVDYKIDYNYFGVNEELVQESDVIFDTDTINIGNVFYFTPEKELNKVNVTSHKVDVKNHKQYDYELIEDGHDVTFLGDQIKRHIVVKKDFDGQKAKNVDVELIQLEEGVEIEDSRNVVGRVTLSEKNNWTHTFQDMPRYTEEQLTKSISERDGEYIEYGVREVDFETSADGYTSVVKGNEIENFVIVNKELEDVDVIIEKVWVGTKGNRAEFEVKVNGKTMETVSMTSKDEWVLTVPLKQIPYDAEITVEELTVEEGYDVNVIEEGDNKFIMESVERLGSLEILMNKGENDPKVSMVQVERDITDMSKAPAEEETEEDIEEEEIEEDIANVESTRNVGGTRLAGARFLVESKEVEEDEEGNEVSVYSKEVITNQEGLAVIADIPFGDYTITEIETPEGYEFGKIKSIDFTVSENQTRNQYRADFYNERAKVEAQDLDITVSNKWEFNEHVSGFTVPEELEMKLVSKLPNGEIHEESEVFTLNEANDWEMKFTKMPNVNNTNDYDELSYSVVVTSEIDGDFELEVTKTGSYFNNEGNEVNILATNVERLGKVHVINVEGSEAPTDDFKLGEFTKSIEGAKYELRETDSNKLVRESSTAKDGKLSMFNLPYGEYTLTETEAPKGYLQHETNSINITVDGPQTRGGVNVKFENEIDGQNTVSVDVRSEWKDAKGKDLDLDLVKDKEIKVELYRNEIEQGQFATLNAENDWKVSFENLRKYEVGTDTEFEYSVKEIIESGSALATGFNTELQGNAKDGFVLVNTQINPDVINVPVVKKWMDGAEELDKVTLQLMEADKMIEQIVITAEDDWKGTFKGIQLTRNDNQETIDYTLVELDHEGYKSSVYGNADESGFEVRNTETTDEDTPTDVDKPTDVEDTPTDVDKPTDVEDTPTDVDEPTSGENIDGERFGDEKFDDKEAASGGKEVASEGFKQTATSAIGLGLFAVTGLAGVGTVAYKKRKEEKEEDEDED